MAETLKPSDGELQELVNARREEVVRLQKAQADHVKDVETRGQARITALKKSLPKDVVSALDGLDKAHQQAEATTKRRVARTVAAQAKSNPSAEGETAVHPGLAGGRLVAP